MACLIGAAGDIRRGVLAACGFHLTRAGIWCGQRRGIARAQQTHGLLRRAHLRLTAGDNIGNIDAAVGDARNERLQICNVLVGDLNVLVNEADHLEHTADLLNLQDLLRRDGAAVDGQRADDPAVHNALRDLGQLDALAVLADVELDEAAVRIDQAGIVEHFKLLSRPRFVTVVKLGQRTDERLRHARGKNADGKQAQRHRQRQEQAEDSFP